MREAMAHAAVGDDVFGEDPTVRALEERVADLLGHEAGLFSPTGLAGQPARHAAARRPRARSSSPTSRRTCCGPRWAPARSSRASPAARGRASAACSTRPARCRWSRPGSGRTRSRPRSSCSRTPTTSAAARCSRSRPSARCAPPPGRVGVAMHLDGARLWNAHVASGVSLRDYGTQFDTVSVCLSKGLGAPVGSVLVGSAEQMAEARIWRKRYGAGMRQVGILAAAGLYALDHNIERLADDHARAARFAAACARGGTGSRRRRHRRDQHRRARRRRSRLGRTGVRRRAARAGRAHVCRRAGPGARRVAPRRRRRRHGCRAWTPRPPCCARARPEAAPGPPGRQPGVAPVSTLRMLPSGSSNHTPRASPPIDATPSSQVMPGASKVWNVHALRRAARRSRRRSRPAGHLERHRGRPVGAGERRGVDEEGTGRRRRRGPLRAHHPAAREPRTPS